MNYKWNADIIRDTETNRYRAIISFNYRRDADIEGNGWRDLAEYAMREAFYLEHINEFVLPSFTNAERVKMAARVCEEHKSIFEPSTDCA